MIMFLLILSGFNLTDTTTQRLAEYGAGQIGYFVMETVSLLYYSGDRITPFGILTEPVFSEVSVTPSILLTGRIFKDKKLSLWKTAIGVGAGSLIGTIGLYKYQEYVYGGEVQYGETGTELKYKLIPVFVLMKAFLPSFLGVVMGHL